MLSTHLRSAAIALLAAFALITMALPTHAATTAAPVITMTTNQVFTAPGQTVTNVFSADQPVTWSMDEEGTNSDAQALVTVEKTSGALTIGSTTDVGEYEIVVKATNTSSQSAVSQTLKVVVGDFPGTYFALIYQRVDDGTSVTIYTQLLEVSPDNATTRPLGERRALGGIASAFDIAGDYGYLLVDTPDSADELFKVSLSTGQFDSLGPLPVGLYASRGLDVRQVNDAITAHFVARDRDSQGKQNLYSLNISAQKLLPKQVLTFGKINDEGFEVSGLASDPNGTLYASTQTEAEPQLALKITGFTYTVVGNLRLDFDGIDFDQSGRLIGLRASISLYVLNLAKGADYRQQGITKDLYGTDRRLFNLPAHLYGQALYGQAFAIKFDPVNNNQDNSQNNTQDQNPLPQVQPLLPTSQPKIELNQDTFTCIAPTFDQATDSITFTWTVDGQVHPDKTATITPATTPATVTCEVLAQATSATSTITAQWTRTAATTPTPTPPTPSTPAPENKPITTQSSPLTLNFVLTRTKLTKAHLQAITSANLTNAKAITIHASARNGGNKAANLILAKQRAKATEAALRAQGFKGTITTKVSLSVPKVVITVTALK